MSGNGEAPAPAIGRLVITFGADGRDCSVVPEGPVQPAQVFLAAWFLDQWAREFRQAMVQNAPRLTVAGPTALDHLAGGGRRRGS